MCPGGCRLTAPCARLAVRRLSMYASLGARDCRGGRVFTGLLKANSSMCKLSSSRLSRCSGTTGVLAWQLETLDVPWCLQACSICARSTRSRSTAALFNTVRPPWCLLGSDGEELSAWRSATSLTEWSTQLGLLDACWFLLVMSSFTCARPAIGLRLSCSQQPGRLDACWALLVKSSSTCARLAHTSKSTTEFFNTARST